MSAPVKLTAAQQAALREVGQNRTVWPELHGALKYIERCGLVRRIDRYRNCLTDAGRAALEGSKP